MNRMIAKSQLPDRVFKLTKSAPAIAKKEEVGFILIVKALKAAGIHITSVLRFQIGKLVILEDESRIVSDKSIVMTYEGSKEKKGLITEGIESIINKHPKIDLAFTISPTNPIHHSIQSKFPTRKPHNVLHSYTDKTI